jgi:hypothetical protein
MGIYILQTLTLLLAPALFAASVYMVLGRLIQLTRGESLAPIRATWLSFLVQSGGKSPFLFDDGLG